MQIDNEELTYLYYTDEMNENVFHVFNKFKDIIRRCCDDEFSNWNVDPDKFYCDNINIDCKYYSDENCRNEVKCLDGLSIIHFNARKFENKF